MTRTPLALACALSLAACTTVGPDYVAPKTAVSDRWIEEADTGAIDPAWWEKFGDPELTALIEKALAGSPTVAEAEARLAEARANRDAVLGRRLPQASAAGSASESQISENGQLPVSNIPGFENPFSLFDLGFDASWEIDLWGRHVREAQGAEARAGAAQARLQDVLVMLTAEIARNYMDLRAAQANVSYAQDGAAAADDLATLMALRDRAGESSKFEADSAKAYAATARETLARSRSQASSAAYRLGALVGVAPEKIVPELRRERPLPKSPQTILVGVRSELLRRRPDVRAAERDLAAATADIGVATANLFPRFSLMGGLGTQARTSGDLFEDGSTRFSIGPSFSWPIFSGGRIHAQIRAAGARADAAAARYDKTVVEALADSESMINRYLEAQKAAAEAKHAQAAQANAFKLAKLRFEQGEDDRLALDRARLDLISKERSATAAKADTARAAVAVFKALGGGWEAP